MADIFLYIEGFYNRRRLHSTLGYVSPDDFERQFSLRGNLALHQVGENSVTGKIDVREAGSWATEAPASL